MKSSALDMPAPSGADCYTYSDHDQDVGVVARGATLERAFECAAEATFALTADLEHVHARRTLPVSFIEHDDACALLRWLTLLIEAAREHRLVFSEFHLQRERGHWWGCATGELRRTPPQRDLRVKPVGIAVARTARGWEASCTVQYRRGPPSLAQQPATTADPVR